MLEQTGSGGIGIGGGGGGSGGSGSLSHLQVPGGSGSAGGVTFATTGAKTPRSLLRAALDSENHGYPQPSPFTPQPIVFHLYAVRWYVLVLFSLMALFNNAICYTVGSVYKVSRRYYYVGCKTQQPQRPNRALQ